ncbi:MAG: ABC transporter permease [Prevotellaceae bacterium]|jgi:ABC-2 type transport system permease protein|nr:ABC transporter permease [Prevotellaceae bacterium]
MAKSRFQAFVRKEFLHIFRDRRTLLILFGIPITMLILFGYALTNEVKNINVAVADYSGDPMTRQIVQQIGASGFFNVTQKLYSPEEYEEVLRSGTAKLIVVFESNFERNFVANGTANIQLIADASEPNTAQLITNYVNAIVQSYVAEKTGVKHNPYLIDIKTRMLYNEDMKESYNFVPGLFAVILMLISAMMTSITITREKETGTMEVLLASPLRPTQIIFGKVTPYFVLSMLNAIVILLVGTLLFGVPVKGSLVLLMVEILLYVFVALSLGILISTAVKEQIAAMAFSGFALMMPTMLLSGFIFQVKNMPVVLQVLANVMPPRWFIEINRGIMLKGADLTVLWWQTLFLAGLAAVFLIISVRKFKIRLE